MKYVRIRRGEGFGVCFLHILAGIGLSLKHQNELTYVYDPSLIKYVHGVTNEHVKQLIDLEKLFPIPQHVEREKMHGCFGVHKIRDNHIQTHIGLVGHVNKYGIHEIYKQAADFIKPHLTNLQTPYSDSFTNVAVHIRRGDVKPDHIRYSPLELYVKYIKKISSMPSDKPYKFYIFTQGTPNFKTDFKEILELPNVVFFVDNTTNPLLRLNPSADRGMEAVQTWYALTKADILCTSNSAFSFTAAFFNSNVVHYLPFKDVIPIANNKKSLLEIIE